MYSTNFRGLGEDPGPPPPMPQAEPGAPKAVQMFYGSGDNANPPTGAASAASGLSIFNDLLGRGAKANSAFLSFASGLSQADSAARSKRMTIGIVAVGGLVVAGGLLAYFFKRK